MFKSNPAFVAALSLLSTPLPAVADHILEVTPVAEWLSFIAALIR